MKKQLEIACFNKASARMAQKAGANRIELSLHYAVGGITPTEDLIEEVIKEIQLPVHVLIRPRDGNFLYTEEEMIQMFHSIVFCKKNKVPSVVFGVLDLKNEIDVSRCVELIREAKPMKTVFHRAIDTCVNKEKAFEQLIKLGFEAVLTSGGERQAVRGIENLKRWQKEFGQHISIIPGGGLRSSNLSQLLETDCSVYHSSAITDDSETASESEIKKLSTLLGS